MASLNGLPDFGKPASNNGFLGFDENENFKKRVQPQKKQKNNKFGHRQEEAYGGEDGISEDIEQEEEQDNRIIEQSLGHQAGITVSASLGIDPSVDSLALDEYDHIEVVEI